MVDSYRDKDVVVYFLLPACLSTAGFNYLIHDYLQRNPVCFLTCYNSAIWPKISLLIDIVFLFQKAVQRIKEISVKVKKDDKG